MLNDYGLSRHFEKLTVTSESQHVFNIDRIKRFCVKKTMHINSITETFLKQQHNELKNTCL